MSSIYLQRVQNPESIKFRVATQKDTRKNGKIPKTITNEKSFSRWLYKRARTMFSREIIFE